MDLTTTIIGAFILALCITPLVIAYNKRKKRERLLRQALLNYAASQSGKITKHDIWPDTAIGIDEDVNRIYFLKKGTSGKEYFTKADLSSIKSISIAGEENPEHTDKLELILEHRSNPVIALEFYNRERALQINEELQLIKKWQAIINSKLK